MASKEEKIFINELEMAKKRDHKILITEAAIEKIPLVKYKEIPESEYLMLQELAKEVLKVSKNDNDSNEVALTYSLDYRKLIAEGKEFMGVALGDEHSVDPCMNAVSYLVKKDCYNRRKAIEIYNHAVSVHNDGKNIQDYQQAVAYFLSNCYEANIVYEDR
ncbi:MAG: hypothetical protein NC313_15930 [Butyrivibrio sp.]|nr:hypothetical protein [Butyrivibrio sp.]